MKNIKLLALFAAAVLMAACSSDTAEVLEPSTPNNEPKTYKVSLNLEGEYVDITEEPLTRADEDAPKKLYGINVYSMKTDGSESSYSNYAYGVFDNKEDMVITLLEGYKYKFQCTSVIEGEGKFPSYYFDHSSSNTFSEPFTVAYGLSVSDVNQFKNSTSIYLRGLEYGDTFTSNGSYYYPKMDRYYGEIEDFDPATTNVATIPLKRTVFGMKLVVPSVHDGSLSVSAKAFEPNLYSGREIHIYSQPITEPVESAAIYSFYDVYDCWKAEDTYTASVTLTFEWTRANGIMQSFTKDITVKRNVMTVLTVNLDGGSRGTSGVTIGIEEEEQTEMGIEYDEVSFNG